MPQYVVLSRLTQEGRKIPKERPERLKEVNQEIAKIKAEVMQRYALLGKYDFHVMLQAPDNDTVVKIMVELGSQGTSETATLAAIPIDEFLKMVR